MQNANPTSLMNAHEKRWMLVNVGLVVASISFFVGFLVINNRVSADGFVIRGLEHRLAELEDQKRQLDMKMLDRQAMGNVAEQAKSLGYVPVDQVEYITIGSGSVAMR